MENITSQELRLELSQSQKMNTDKKVGSEQTREYTEEDGKIRKEEKQSQDMFGSQWKKGEEKWSQQETEKSKNSESGFSGESKNSEEGEVESSEESQSLLNTEVEGEENSLEETQSHLKGGGEKRGERSEESQDLGNEKEKEI